MAATVSVGFIGFGEAGGVFAKGLSKNGVEDILVYASGKRNRPPYSPEFLKKVDAAGARAVDSLEAVVSGSEVIFSSVVVAAAEEVGLAVAKAIKPGQLLVDINSCGPQTKIAVSQAVEAAGGLYADTAVLGNVTIYGLSVPLKVSGSGAKRFKELFDPLGMKIQLLNDQAGSAATLKMVRSLVMKGAGMVILEALLAGRALGLTDEVFQAITEPMDNVKFSDWAKMGVRTNGLAAKRRADETAEAIELIKAHGVDPVMASAALERFRRLETLNFQDIFPGEPPADYREYLPHYVEVSPEGVAR